MKIDRHVSSLTLRWLTLRELLRGIEQGSYDVRDVQAEIEHRLRVAVLMREP